MHEENKREHKPRPRYHLKNKSRFFSVLAVLAILIVTISVLLTPKNAKGNIVPTSTTTIQAVVSTASPTPAPTILPTPEGKRKAPLLVVIDPGHGGRDPGAVSPTDQKVYEKNIVLSVALMVRDRLEAEGIPVKMTRETDEELSPTVNADLLSRAQIANEADATLFVSIHLNSYDLKQNGGSAVNGMEIYYYQGTRMTYDHFDAKKLAETLAKDINAVNGMPVGDPLSRGLSVLRNTQMPAALVEIGYITNVSDREKLMDDDFLQQTATGISNGIISGLNLIGVDKSNEPTVFKNE